MLEFLKVASALLAGLKNRGSEEARKRGSEEARERGGNGTGARQQRARQGTYLVFSLHHEARSYATAECSSAQSGKMLQFLDEINQLSSRHSSRSGLRGFKPTSSRDVIEAVRIRYRTGCLSARYAPGARPEMIFSQHYFIGALTGVAAAMSINVWWYNRDSIYDRVKADMAKDTAKTH
eukprot:gene11564-34271_t